MRVRRFDDGVRIVEGGPVPPGSDGITIGSFIFVRAGHADSPYLIAHERVHVEQWRNYGAVGFVARYGGAYLRWRLRGYTHKAAYRRIPFEIEADWRARRKY
jgi:hypothetical protein